MGNYANRNFGCKDEELPVICGFGLYSLKRDLADFAAYSPKFDPAWVAGFEAKIAEVNNLLEPKSETVKREVITERLYATMDGLIPAINRLNGYVKMAHDSLKISPADFGLTPLRNAIGLKDAEGVMKHLNTVILNNAAYFDLLARQGFTAELAARFTEAASAIAADKAVQHALTSKRKSMVQDHTAAFNGLYAQFSEIMEAGKILYKGTDAVKLQEYTFSYLLSQVRRVTKPAGATKGAKATTTASPEA